jgi:hypothetical protein
MGDNMQYYKYILRNVAKRHNRTVTFMPKPVKLLTFRVGFFMPTPYHSVNMESMTIFARADFPDSDAAFSLVF